MEIRAVVARHALPIGPTAIEPTLGVANLGLARLTLTT